MNLNEIIPTPGSRKKKKVLGRGRSSGHGKTSTRGTKGQGSRKSGNVRPGFEGGQMPIYRRLPKRGFKNFNQKIYVAVNVGRLNDLFNENEEVSPEALIKKGIVKKLEDGVKILGDGTITKPLVVKAHAFSAMAKEKIEAAGGKIEVI
ncbi:50S ribosomal protein L15 [Mesoaciditoga sp.]